jgi:hypothetical protein
MGQEFCESLSRSLKNTCFAGCSKTSRCKAPEIPKSEAYIAVRRRWAFFSRLLGFPFDPFVYEGSELFAVKPHIGFFPVHDKCRILENPVPDLLPKSKGRLGLNDLKTHPVTVQAGDLGNAIRKIAQGLFPIFGIFLVA